MKSRTSIWAAVVGLLIAGPLASCGDDSAKSGTDEGSQEQVMSAQTDLGTILVDEEGKTLYVFTQDSPGTSTCEGGCLDTWPAVSGEATAGEGADESLLGSIERSDGSTQATYADWPLYYYAQDQSAGDVNGQGVGDVWYVVGPDGTVIKKVPETGSVGGGGY